MIPIMLISVLPLYLPTAFLFCYFPHYILCIIEDENEMFAKSGRITALERMNNMGKHSANFPISKLEDLHTEGAGFDVLRYLALPDLLGEEAPTLLYFMGKNLARKFDIQSIDDIIYIFDQLGIGKLELVKEKKKEKIFHLLSDSVVLRLKGPFEADFRLEAGFLAEAVQRIEGTECECTEEINRRIHQIQFNVVYTNL